MKDKILTVISIIMEANINNLDENTSSENVENWDSLRHMNLIVAVEEEFEIEFNASGLNVCVCFGTIPPQILIK